VPPRPTLDSLTEDIEVPAEETEVVQDAELDADGELVHPAEPIEGDSSLFPDADDPDVRRGLPDDGDS